MGRGVGGKDRPSSHSGSSPRYGERERRTGWGVAPLSRKLWVGNLGSRMTENILSEQFLRFGDIENISYVPGRSFAYVNFKKEEDAHLALRSLHGSSVAGTPLRIEFAKGRRASILLQDDEHRQHKNDRRSIERGEPPQRRDLRFQHYSPEKSSDKSKSYKSSDPSEVLWIGFPSFLNVDEIMLRRAFSPFGEIEKITSFPGRSYGFVRYRSIVAACRAKEALQGKLFNNPRVSICFARSDVPTEHGKVSENGSYTQHLKHKFFPGSNEQDFDQFHSDEGFDLPVREFQRDSPPFRSNLDRARGDAHAVNFARSNTSRFDAGSFENTRLREFVSERRSEDIFERQRSSPEERSPIWRNIPFERRQRFPPFEDSFAADERSSFPLAKKHKFELLPDKDLPEYPFSDLEQDKHDNQRKPFLALPDHQGFNRPLDSVPFSLKSANDFSRSQPHPRSEIDDTWGNVGGLNAGSSRPLLNSPKLHRSNPEPHKPPPPPDEMWKWEGTIAKGGTQVCRARCFPVGKVLDFMLPEFLNCTARTGLDMLAKHYYQAVATWVVFFVPESDADISFYNEFMHYLGEKQRTAVAKLGEKVTLFLVPPSDFSEQVLKVPGKVSISGVILKFQQNASNFPSLHHPMNSTTEPKASSLIIHEGASFLKPNSPDFTPFYHKKPHHAGLSSGYLNPGIFPPPFKQDERHPYPIPSHGGKPRDVYIDDASDHVQLHNHNPPLQPDWSGKRPVSSLTVSTSPSQAFGRSFSKDFSSVNSRVAAHGMTDSSGYMHETFASTSATKFPLPPDIKPPASSATPATLQPEQLAQLAAILGNQRQYGEADERERYSRNQSSQNTTLMTYSNSSLPSASVEIPSGHVQQVHVQGQPPPDASPVQKTEQHTDQQELKNSREDAEADPEKRLQATLQLAAALLQQIQQRSKAVD